MFGIGQAAPHLQSIAQARAAAYTLWEIIDTVIEKKFYSKANRKIIGIFVKEAFQLSLAHQNY